MIKFAERFMSRAFLVASSYIPFITKYRKASCVQRVSRYYKSSVEALGRPFEADADLRPPNTSYGTSPGPYIGKVFN